MLKCVPAAVAALALLTAAPAAHGSDIFYSCYPELCRVAPDGSGKRQLTHDGDDMVGDRYQSIYASSTGRISFTHGNHTYLADRDARHRRRFDRAYAGVMLHPYDDHVMWWDDTSHWCRGTLGPLDYECDKTLNDSRIFFAWGANHSLLTVDHLTQRTICTTKIRKDRRLGCKRVVVREHDERSFYPHPAVSPDGKLLAVPVSERYDAPYAGTAIVLYDVRTGTRLRLLTSGHHSDDLPVWSPDGRYVAFRRYLESADGRAYGVARVRATGGKVKVIARWKDVITDVAWGG